MKAYCLIILQIILFCGLQAQNQNNTWVFGKRAGLDFNSGSPLALNGVKMNTLEGSSSISDKNTGALLFYTNGSEVWNKNHNIMPNGSGLLGNFSTAQTLIVPMPGSDSLYYVFSSDAGFLPIGAGNLVYSVVDMTLNNDSGDVIAGIKNVVLMDSATEKIAAVQHSNGCDFWILTHRTNNDEYVAFQLTNQGINSTPTITNIGATHTGSQGKRGTLEISPDGSKVAGVIYSNIELMDFNTTTGVYSNRQVLAKSLAGSSVNIDGVCFSPDNSKLYAGESRLSGSGNTYSIYQYDLNNGNNKVELGPTIDGNAHMKIAPDGKIYVAQFDYDASFVEVALPKLGVINNPNATGIAASYNNNGLSLTAGKSLIGLPNFPIYNPGTISCYIIKADTTIDTIATIILDTLDIYIPNAFSPNNDGINDFFGLRVYSNTTFNLEYLKIFDRWGRLVFETKSSSPTGGALSVPDSYRVEGWDGTKNGHALNEGVYVYIAAYLLNEETQIKKGNITLLR